MTKEDIMAMIAKGSIQVQGDLVVEKHVAHEIGNVESGGIGIQIVNAKHGEELNATGGQPAAGKPATGEPISEEHVEEERCCEHDEHDEHADHVEGDEALFHFVHPSLDDEEAWQVHHEVKRLLRRQGIQEICQYLGQMKAERRILLPQSVKTAYQELVRMGMPSGEGFNEKTFQKYYNK